MSLQNVKIQNVKNAFFSTYQQLFFLNFSHFWYSKTHFQPPFPHLRKRNKAVEAHKGHCQNACGH